MRSRDLFEKARGARNCSSKFSDENRWNASVSVTTNTGNGARKETFYADESPDGANRKMAYLARVMKNEVLDLPDLTSPQSLPKNFENFSLSAA